MNVIGLVLYIGSLMTVVSSIAYGIYTTYSNLSSNIERAIVTCTLIGLCLMSSALLSYAFITLLRW